MRDLILSIKNIDEDVTDYPVYYYEEEENVGCSWKDEVSWNYLEVELGLSRLLILDLKNWLNAYADINVTQYRVLFEVRGLELLLKLRQELKDKCRVHYYSDLFQDYLMDEE